VILARRLASGAIDDSDFLLDWTYLKKAHIREYDYSRPGARLHPVENTMPVKNSKTRPSLAGVFGLLCGNQAIADWF
jgi:hypothetical protein